MSEKYYNAQGKEKKQIYEILLCFFLGWCGAHKFYMGDTKIGILYALTLGLVGIGWIGDFLNLVINYFIPLTDLGKKFFLLIAYLIALCLILSACIAGCSYLQNDDIPQETTTPTVVIETTIGIIQKETTEESTINIITTPTTEEVVVTIPSTTKFEETIPPTTIVTSTETTTPAETAEVTVPSTEAELYNFIGNKKSHMFHTETCKSGQSIIESNRIYFYGVTAQEVIEQGYIPCSKCHPQS